MIETNSFKPPSGFLTVALAGCGKMGSAMALAWANALHVSRIDILDPSGVPDTFGGSIKITGTTSTKEFLAKADDWDILVLALKPQIMDTACNSLAQALPKSVPLLSIAAGKNLAFFAEKFGEDHQIIRAMPNTPAAIGKGMSVAVASPATTQKTIEQAHFLLSCLGKTSWVKNEDFMDIVTAVSGSGPAYVFYLIEVMTQAAMVAGLDRNFAMTLARQTVIGAGALAEHDVEHSPAELRQNVTSPNGTTAAALAVLMDGRLQQIMIETVAKAAARSKELSDSEPKAD